MTSSQCLTAPEVTPHRALQSPEVPHDKRVLIAAGCAALLCITFASYAVTLPAFFCLDDFTFIRFVSSVNEAGLRILWTIFATPVYEIQPWLKCYRPLPDVVFLLEYLAFGLNATMFRLTNLVCHFGCAMLTWQIGTTLFSRAGLQSAGVVAFCAAALFSAWPVPAEVVYAPTNVIVLLCAVTFLGSIAAYLQERKTLSLVLFCLSLLCKEQAVVLPAVLISLTSRGIPVAFWLMFVPYFGIRYAVLGEFVGGYKDWVREALQASWRERLFGNWPQTLALPMNPFAWTNPAAKTWFASLYVLPGLVLSSRIPGGRTGRSARTALPETGNAAKTAIPDWMDREHLRLGLTMAFWALACLLPTIPVFCLDPQLVGGRHFYLSAPPTMLLLALCMYNVRLPKLSIVACSALVVAFVIINATNNRLYANAANSLNLLRNGVERICSQSDGSIVIANPPTSIDGTLTLANYPMFDALFSPPFVSSSVSSKTKRLTQWRNQNEDMFDIQELSASKTDLYVWDNRRASLEKFRGDFGDGSLMQELIPVRCHFDQTQQISELTFVPTGKELAGQADLFEFDLCCTPLRPVPPNIYPAASLRFEPNGETDAVSVIADGTSRRYRFKLNKSLLQIHERRASSVKLLLPSPYFKNQVTNVRLLGWGINKRG